MKFLNKFENIQNSKCQQLELLNNEDNKGSSI